MWLKLKRGKLSGALLVSALFAWLKLEHAKSSGALPPASSLWLKLEHDKPVLSGALISALFAGLKLELDVILPGFTGSLAKLVAELSTVFLSEIG